jgi:SET domain-containing protein
MVPIPTGTLLVVYGGSILSRAQLEERPELRRVALQVAEDGFLVSDREGPGDWVNHSCDPNAGLCGQIALVGLRPIAAGEEICFGYAMSDGWAYDEFDCVCGSALCRRRVTGDDWRTPDLQERYRGHFSPHLEARIRALYEPEKPQVA